MYKAEEKFFLVPVPHSSICHPLLCHAHPRCGCAHCLQQHLFVTEKLHVHCPYSPPNWVFIHLLEFANSSSRIGSWLLISSGAPNAASDIIVTCQLPLYTLVKVLSSENYQGRRN
jgi:hypothetical protein